MKTLEEHNRQLRERVEELEEELRQVRSATAPHIEWQQLNLTVRERELLSILYTRSPNTVTKESLETLMRVTRECVTAHVMKLRKKIAPVPITTMWGAGYALPASSKASLVPSYDPNRGERE
jgi:DNA-binding response OmpR family regulator